MFKKKNNQSQQRRSTTKGGNALVFSYYASRSQNTAPTGRFEQRQSPSFNWKLLPSYIALMAILVSFAYVLTLSSDPRILPHGQDDSVVLQPTKAYQRSAGEILRGSVFNYSKLLINTRDIEQRLHERFPELEHISITVPLTSRRPIIAIEPATPGLVLSTKTSNFIIDMRGTAILKTDNLDAFSRLNLPRLTDDSGLEPLVGKTSLPSDTVRFIREVNRQLSAKGLVFESLALPVIANELHVRIKGEGYFIKFNIQGDPRLQAGTYLAVKDRLSKDKIKPAEYIDVRIEEKVFYR